MDPRLDLLTVAVPDLDIARRFYCEGLGWPSALDVPDEILFIQVNSGLLLGFYGAEALAADMGVDVSTVVPGAGFTLAHNVGSAGTVRSVMERAEAAGATVVKAPQNAAFGGYHGYFADPVGIRWEVAYNPGWHVDAYGKVSIGPVDD
jgi:catechol 2,3-dioxygenase-like lactoylglutathione lyase family enzyme